MGGPMNPRVLPDRVVGRVEGAVTLKAKIDERDTYVTLIFNNYF